MLQFTLAPATVLLQRDTLFLPSRDSRAVEMGKWGEGVGSGIGACFGPIGLKLQVPALGHEGSDMHHSLVAQRVIKKLM